ncbi:MAG TPA: TetR/AcrR family transcriptional regulator, partial [Anaerolineae bacterium]|nr:TetR/AcrR family transcriptional regulator [Anaerolineae bacterium]
IRQATRTAIVEAAMTCFAQNGYAHTSIRQIAAQAGISTGLMYHYFESKEALLEAVFENCMAILSGVLVDAYRQAEPGERISGLLRAMFAMLEDDREFWALFQMLRSQPAITAVVGDAFRRWTRRLRNLFTVELRGAGRDEPEVDALILYSLIEGTIQQYLLDPDEYPLSTVAERIVGEYGG